jgi:hypothetical protein
MGIVTQLEFGFDKPVNVGLVKTKLKLSEGLL